MADVQRMVQALVALEEGTLLTVLTSVLENRAELAPAVVTFAVPDLTYPPSKALLERRAEGVIKSFNPTKGFGFIECQELQAVFGNDVFLHSSQIGSFQPGTAVSFAVVLNKDNKPQAYDLQPLDASKSLRAAGATPVPTAAPRQPAKGASKGWHKGNPAATAAAYSAALGWASPESWGALSAWDATGAWATTDWAAAAQALQTGKGAGLAGQDGAGVKRKLEEQTMLGQFAGVIKSFNVANGYGFIDCPELKLQGYQNDAFLHHQQLGTFQVGDTVTFTCYLNGKGQPQARELQAAGDAELAPVAKRVRVA